MVDKRIDIIVAERGAKTVETNIRRIGNAAKDVAGDIQAVSTAARGLSGRRITNGAANLELLVGLINRIRPSSALSNLAAGLTAVRGATTGLSGRGINVFANSLVNLLAAFELAGSGRARAGIDLLRQAGQVAISVARLRDATRGFSGRSIATVSDNLARLGQGLRQFGGPDIRRGIRNLQLVATAVQSTAGSQSITRLARDLQGLNRRLNQTARASTRAADASRQFGGALGGVGAQIRFAVTGLLVFRLFDLPGQILAAADAFTQLQNRIRLVTDTQQQFNVAQRGLIALSNETRTSLAANAELFNRVTLSTRELGVSQAQALEFTRRLNQAVIISGSTAQEARNGIIQLSQGLASGALRGDELRSVLEQLPRVADIIAKELGVTRGELRKLGEQGEITSEVILRAFRNVGPELQQEFDQVAITLEQGLVVFQNRFTVLAGTILQSSTLGEALGQSLITIANGLDAIQPALTTTAAILAQITRFFTDIVPAVLGSLNSITLFSRTLEELGLSFQLAEDETVGFLDLFLALQRQFGAGVQTIAQGAELLSNVLVELFAGVARLVIGTREQVSINLEEILTETSVIFFAVARGVELGIRSVFDVLTNAGPILVALWSGILNDVFIRPVNQLTRLLVAAFNTIRGVVTDALRGIVESAEDSGRALRFALRGEFSRAAEFAGDALERIGEGVDLSTLGTRISLALEEQADTVLIPLIRTEAAETANLLGETFSRRWLEFLGGFFNQNNPFTESIRFLFASAATTEVTPEVERFADRLSESFISAFVRPFQPQGKFQQDLNSSLESIRSRIRTPLESLVAEFEKSRQLLFAALFRASGPIERAQILQDIRRLNELFKQELDDLNANTEDAGRRAASQLREFSASFQGLSGPQRIDVSANFGAAGSIGDLERQLSERQGALLSLFAQNEAAITDLQSDAQLQQNQRLQETLDQRLALRQSFIEQELALEEAAQQRRERLQREQLQSQVAASGNFATAALTLARTLGSQSAKAQARFAVAQIGINTAVAISRAFAEAGVLGGLPLASLAAAQGAAQIAAVQRSLQQSSGFQQGGFTGSGPVDQVAGVVHRQEFVMNAAATRRNRSLLEALNRGQTVSRAVSAPASSGSINTGGMQVNIMNNASNLVTTTAQEDADGNLEVYIDAKINEAIGTRIVPAVASSISNPNSQVSQALSRNTTATRKR